MLGGVVIVMRRVETGEVYSGEISLEYFRKDKFKEKSYLDASLKIIAKGIKKLDIKTKESLYVCSGYVLSSIREYLRSKGYMVTKKKITGITQDIAEKEFKNSLVELGVGSMSEVESMRSYYGYIEWLKKDFPAREKYVKTGWSSWAKWKKDINV